jgi:hypothetical protein
MAKATQFLELCTSGLQVVELVVIHLAKVVVVVTAAAEAVL